jgi:NAD-dependent dihydropyrimidine dehydrogenase PreA subunit
MAAHWGRARVLSSVAGSCSGQRTRALRHAFPEREPTAILASPVYASNPRRVGSGERPGGRELTYVIAEPCIDVLDISCVSVCPVDCIHYEEGVDRKLFIDPNECIDCGACEPECPVNAIFPEESLPPEWANYTQIDAIWYTDKAAARAMTDELKPSG